MVARIDVDIKRIAKKTKRKLETAAQEVTMDLAEAAIMRTPVDTGFAVGSWYVGLNNSSEIREGIPDNAGAVIGRVSLGVSQMEVGDVVYILNNASYIQALENGHSQQAPQGMVAITVNDAPQIAERTIQRIAKQ